MSLPPPHLAPVFARIRTGDIPGAYTQAQQILRSMPDDQPLLALAGMLGCRAGDLPGGIDRLRRALALNPGDQPTRNNLVRALIESEELEGAAAIAAAGPQDVRSLRLTAYIHQRLGHYDAAIADYRRVVAELGDDFESWNNLGNLLAGIGAEQEARDALRRAIALRPDVALCYVNLSKLLNRMRRDDERLELARAATDRFPDDPEVQLELGLSEATIGNFEAAEAAYRAAIRLDGTALGPYLELAVLLENLNRTEALSELADAAERQGLPAGEAGFIKAWALRREGRFAEALPFAEAIPETISPVRRNQLIGELADRIGAVDIAYQAFEAMNAAALARTPAGQRDPNLYLDEIRTNGELLAAGKIAGWTAVTLDPGPATPIFLVGFPRSGTTLLDTLLMNIPELHVLEEMPIVRSVEEQLGDPSRLAGLSSEEANALRSRYFETLDALSPPRGGQVVVDKFPLHMARMGIIHRIFPDAKVIFVERHPCDCVLSAFMSNFELNRAMLSFTSLTGAASLYDLASRAWTNAERHLPLNLHRIRYEHMVEDLETEMRSLLGFLGIGWRDSVLDNQSSAALRNHIRTASYSQVTEPIYKRSAGRWERYRRQMEPVLPILRPWAQAMGYKI